MATHSRPETTAVHWDHVLLDKLATRGSGHTPSRSHPEYWNGSILWISLSDSDRLDDVYISTTAKTISLQGLANSSAVLHPAGTVVLSRDAGVGKSAIMIVEMAVSQHFLAWRCGPALDNVFLYYVLQAKKPEFERIAMGNTIKTIGLPYFKELVIPLPSLAEQRAIASALSDMDALLSTQEKLIAKKRSIKSACMQQLLAGRKRLPGFGEGKAWMQTELGSLPEDWALRPFLKVLTLQSGLVDPRQEPFSSMVLVAPDHIESATGRLLHRSTARQQRAISGKYVFSPGTLVYSKIRPYLKKLTLVDFEGLCSADMYPLAPKQDICIGFIREVMLAQRFSNYAEAVSARSGIPKLNREELAEFVFALPPLREQEAIAEVLSGMDAEIIALEARLAKLRDIKQGMMQELLTGRTRLV